jgi:5,10-methylenetetrahydromethanopterin reductase
MRFGFGDLPTEHYRAHVDLVRRGEELGFDSAWIPDQTFYRDPYVMLALAGEATSRIGLGVGVTNPFTRHPAMAGRAIATVADVAPGRVMLGIGAGNVKELMRPLGLDHRGVAARCREMIELVREQLTGELVDYAGAHYRMVEARMEFTSGRDVPLYLAGRGRRVLEAAGEVADGVMIGALCTAPGIEYALEHVRAGAAHVGRDPDELEVASWVTCRITDDRDAALEEIAPSIAHVIAGAPAHVLDAVGMPAELQHEIKSVYHAEGIPAAGLRLTPECIDALAIVGDADHVVERIRALEAAGVTQFISLLPKSAAPGQMEQLERFAEAVFPAFARAPSSCAL